MPNYRRFQVPGGTYFFTMNLEDRRSDLLVRHIEALREAVRGMRAERPFHIDAWVVLPGHMHCVITLPPGDTDFSNRIKSMKMRFVRAVPAIEERGLPSAPSAASEESGSGGSGTTSYGTTGITPGTWITCSTTR